jgi:hypothetical protein
MHNQWLDIAEPESRDHVEEELLCCELLGETLDNKAIFLYKPQTEAGYTCLLREIGRLREEAFRLVGEGTGQESDVDAYDLYYMHIILWDRHDREIVGAYRLCRTNIIFDASPRRIYTASLFQYLPAAEPILTAGLELGRSFVQEKYWGSRSLDYLWSGIAAFLRRHPEYRYLLGAVSISNDLSLYAKELLVGYYRRFYGSEQMLVKCKQPFQISDKGQAHSADVFEGLDARQAFVVLKKQLRYLGYVVPVLYKQYTELTDEGGSRFLGFNIDPDFNDCIDGLVVVDIQKITQLKRKRYGLDRSLF